MKPLLTILSLFISLLGFSQERRALAGRVVAGGNPAMGVFVINKATGAEVKSGTDGSFSIPARIGDKLAIYSTGVETREFAVNENAFSQTPYTLEVDPKATELDEVVITDISAAKRGLVPKGQKVYTPAERRLKTARSGMGLDQLINLLSGRMAMLKKAVETERKEALMESIDGLFTNDELAGLGVEPELARGFLFYAIEDPRVADAIKSKNDALVKLLLMENADKYKKLQTSNE
ncbi:hypothetical protein [Flavobacterium psychrotrophum]|uniref:hypothetical protein n=1 Tax=Flavobacterium psychrotrophum TaxID=2294119 RepID=UPI000E31EACB|nr:hypothetical protein [Flavobacterium psychrotrophum]